MTDPDRAFRRPRTGSVVTTIARDDLLHLSRDRTALIFMLVLPVLVMVIVGATFKAIPNAVPIGLVDRDGSPAATQVLAALRSSSALYIKVYADEAELRRDVRTQILTGGVVIPEGFGATVAGGRGATLAMVLDLTRRDSQSLAAVVQSVVAHEGTIVGAAHFAVEQVGADPQVALARARDLAGQVPPVPVELDVLREAPADGNGFGSGGTNPYRYTAISNLVLFVFVSTLASGTAVIERRQLGVTRRMLAAPVTTRSIIVGTGASRLLVALLQSATILIVGRIAFGVEWGDPVGVVSLVALFAALSTAVSLLVGSLARNPNQVTSIGIPVAIGLGMLGGCMWPLDIVPRPLQVIGHITPHAWAMDAWIRLSIQGVAPTAIAADLAVLAGFTVVVGVLAALALRRSLLRP